MSPVAGGASKLHLMLSDRAGDRSIRKVLVIVLVLPGIELFDSAALDPVGNERQLLFEQLDRLGSRDLLVLDRGFPAAWLVSVLLAVRSPFACAAIRLRVSSRCAASCARARPRRS